MAIERDMVHHHMSVAIPAFRGWLYEAQHRGDKAADYAVGDHTWEELSADLDAREAQGELYIATACPSPATDGSCPGHED